VSLLKAPLQWLLVLVKYSVSYTCMMQSCDRDTHQQSSGVWSMFSTFHLHIFYLTKHFRVTCTILISPVGRLAVNLRDLFSTGSPHYLATWFWLPGTTVVPARPLLYSIGPLDCGVVSSCGLVEWEWSILHNVPHCQWQFTDQTQWWVCINHTWQMRSESTGWCLMTWCTAHNSNSFPCICQLSTYDEVM